MARVESQAVAGYYKTPLDQVPRIAALLARVEYAPKDAASRRLAVLDPCAGDGEAVVEIGCLLGGEVTYYTCELEESRHAALKERLRYQDQQRALRGDAHCAEYAARPGDGVGLLYLNPPYDTDRVHGRLEERFLVRFAGALEPGGVLALVVPHRALRASAATIGQKFEDVTCWRFAGAAFDDYKQVVLVAKRRDGDLPDPDPAIVAQCEAWAADASGIPELPEPVVAETVAEVAEDAEDAAEDADAEESAEWVDPEVRRGHKVYTVPDRDRYAGDALTTWRMRVVDVAAIVAAYRPWHESRGRGLVGRLGGSAPVARVLPDLPVVELMHREYEVATPPRPAHIAAGLAAGLFNGQRVVPDDCEESRDPKSDLPPLLVKGVFDREWRTVEEKQNKAGETTSVVQVQQPKLVVTVLDLRAGIFHTVRGDLEESGARTVAEMGVADLLKRYGRSLGAVMDRQCRVVYDPRRDAGDVEVAASARPPFVAQAHAVRAIVKVLRERPGRHPLLLGEIGVGKTTVDLLAMKTVGARRPLVMAPPHLMESWKHEVRATFGDEYECRVLESVADVDALAALPPSHPPVVALLSRETAKLGHAWEGLEGGSGCPRCGAPVPRGVDHAKKRSRCAGGVILPGNAWARLARAVALQVRARAPEDPWVRQILCGRVDGELARKRKQGDESGMAPWRGLPAGLVLEVRSRLAWAIFREVHVRGGAASDRLWAALARSLAAAPSTDHAFKCALALHDPEDTYRHHAEGLLALVAPKDREAARAVAAQLRTDREHYASYEKPQTPAVRVEERWKILDGKVKDWRNGTVEVAGVKVTLKGELGLRAIHVDGAPAGSIEAACKLVESLAALGAWSKSPACGEPLYGAVPEPRRYPLATYVARRHKKLFDFITLDEAHEISTSDGSAQERAGHRLAGLGVPTVLMTGSIMNGYAKSLYTNLWYASPEFREEFDRGDGGAFCDRYGYRKRVLTDRDEDGQVVAFGSQTDRVERSERDAGDAPGVLPALLFRHLLPLAVTIQKADLRLDLPPLTQEAVAVDLGSSPIGREVLAEYASLLRRLRDQIKRDRFEEGLSGKLFGQLSELPSYLDRAVSDVGNVEGGGAYEVRYPESVGGGLVASGKCVPAREVLPKEAAMLDHVASEVAAGRRVMVLAWHVGLLPRLARLLKARIGEDVPVLHADKVPAGKRQAWIDAQVVKKRRSVLVTNPVAIQTGLNNLVHFASQWWHECPACNPITYRQAIGRIDRIGQALPTRVAYAYYDGTLQSNLRDLLLAKVAISTATDGLDPESALRAAGIVEDEYLTGLSIGKQLWKMIEAGDAGDEVAAARVRRVVGR